MEIGRNLELDGGVYVMYVLYMNVSTTIGRNLSASL